MHTYAGAGAVKILHLAVSSRFTATHGSWWRSRRDQRNIICDLKPHGAGWKPITEKPGKQGNIGLSNSHPESPPHSFFEMHHLSTKTQAQTIGLWRSVAGPRRLIPQTSLSATRNAKVKASGGRTQKSALMHYILPIDPHLLKNLLCQGSCDGIYKAEWKKIYLIQGNGRKEAKWICTPNKGWVSLSGCSWNMNGCFWHGVGFYSC